MADTWRILDVRVVLGDKDTSPIIAHVSLGFDSLLIPESVMEGCVNEFSNNIAAQTIRDIERGTEQ